jgi:hypothetical protein
MKKIGSLIIDNENFERMLYRFLSENDKNNSLNTNRYVSLRLTIFIKTIEFLKIFLHRPAQQSVV